MEKNNGTGNGRQVDRTLAAMEEMELYCSEHPWSPAAVRRPQLSIRGRTVVALLGPAETASQGSVYPSKPHCGRLILNIEIRHNQRPRMVTKFLLMAHAMRRRAVEKHTTHGRLSGCYA